MRKINGKEVNNSLRSVRITVTDADVEGAVEKDPENCAAARSIKRTLKVDGVRVHRGVTFILRKGSKRWERFKTSGALRLETIIFDRGGRFMMGEYDLLSPPPSMIVGNALRKASRPGSVGTKAKLRARRLVIPGVRPSATKRGGEE